MEAVLTAQNEGSTLTGGSRLEFYRHISFFRLLISDDVRIHIHKLILDPVIENTVDIDRISIRLKQRQQKSFVPKTAF